MASKWTPSSIRRLRKRLGLTQEKMAHFLGVSFATVNRWEKGKTTPKGLSVSSLDDAAEALESEKPARKPRKARKTRKQKAVA